MLKVNTKNTRMTSLTFFSSVSIVDFEQVNVRQDISNAQTPENTAKKIYMKNFGIDFTQFLKMMNFCS